MAELLPILLKEYFPSHIYSSIIEQATWLKTDPLQYTVIFKDSFSKEKFCELCLSKIDCIKKDHSLPNLELKLEVSEETKEKNNTDDFLLVKNEEKFFSNKFTFETFVIGTSNQFAHAASMAVAKQPGRCYNPLLLFGGSGLGKTHLLKAIGYEIRRTYPDYKIIFVNSETFVNELIHAIRLDKMREFRHKYRNECDILLLDDIYFMAGKERTQEEFFYTFNHLHEIGKQIVITSDRYPRDIEGFEKRLQTRFEWGLIADIQPPDTETRIAILKNKAETEHVDLPDNVAQFIATHITSNIRELEGCLHKLEAYSALTGIPITLELAQQVLKDIIPKMKYEITPEAVLKLVAMQFKVKTSDLKSQKKIRKLSLPRQVSMYLIRKHINMSLPEIGKFLGGKDHTTILHGIEKISTLQQTDTDLMHQLNIIESLLR